MQKQQYNNVKDLADAILCQFVNFNPDEKVNRTDKIHLYATQTLTLGLIWHAFNDSIREGDGDRVLACWKFLLVIFKVKGHRNYCKEAIILLYSVPLFIISAEGSTAQVVSIYQHQWKKRAQCAL